MDLPLATSLRALLRPTRAFGDPPPALGKALANMLLVWFPLALINSLWTVWHGLAAYAGLQSGGASAELLQRLGVDPADLQVFLASLPPPPAFGRIWPWLLVAVPLGILGTWLHDAVWDHAGLWLVGGLRSKQGFRTSLVAEAEALRVTAVGTLLGFLAWLPGVGGLLTLPLLLLEAYLWIFRGFALAARHRCEPWRGVLATVIHAVLFGAFALALLAMMLVVARMSA